MANLLGFILFCNVVGNGGCPCVCMDPVVLVCEAAGGGMVGVAPVPRWNHPLRALRASPLLRSVRCDRPEAVRCTAQVVGIHQP